MLFGGSVKPGHGWMIWMMFVFIIGPLCALCVYQIGRVGSPNATFFRIIGVWPCMIFAAVAWPFWIMGHHYLATATVFAFAALVRLRRGRLML
jgi:hypothetical protein